MPKHANGHFGFRSDGRVFAPIPPLDTLAPGESAIVPIGLDPGALLLGVEAVIFRPAGATTRPGRFVLTAHHVDGTREELGVADVPIVEGTHPVRVSLAQPLLYEGFAGYLRIEGEGEGGAPFRVAPVVVDFSPRARLEPQGEA